MAGQPTETMIGVGLLGAGVLLVFAAVKNVSPVALIKQAVTEGVTTLDGLPKIYEPKGSGVPDGGVAPFPELPADVEAICAKVLKADAQLGNDLRNAIRQIDPRFQTSIDNARQYVRETEKKGITTALERATLETEINKRSKK